MVFIGLQTCRSSGQRNHAGCQPLVSDNNRDLLRLKKPKPHKLTQLITGDHDIHQYSSILPPKDTTSEAEKLTTDW